jgi:Protein of unknown function (DUF1559)/Hint domain
MSLSIRCSCGRQLCGPDDCAGKAVQCPICGAVRELPDGNPAAAAREGPDADRNRSAVRTEKPTVPTPMKEEPRRLSRLAIGLRVLAVTIPLVLMGVWFWVEDLSRRRNLLREENLKQMMAAVLRYTDDHNGQLPPVIVYSNDEPKQKLYSWRVELLPYLGETTLYNRFHRDEPWDSAHNLALARDNMPAIYRTPGKPADPGMTSYKFFTGPGSFLHNKEQPYFPDVPNVLGVVEAAKPVFWSKPEDIPFDILGNPLPQLNWDTNGRCPVSTFEGTVRWLPRTMEQEKLKEFINPPPIQPDILNQGRIFCHPGCFPAGTLVQTPEGSKPIETLRVGDAVTVVGRDGVSEPGKVQSVFINRNRLLKVETEDGDLFTTETQPLCLIDGGTLPAGKLKAGDQVFRWQDGKRQAVKVRAATPTDRVEKVFNVILGDAEMFIAGGFLARSKPPAVVQAPQGSAPALTGSSK